VYSRPARILRHIVGSVLTERLASLKRRHGPKGHSNAAASGGTRVADPEGTP